MTTIPDSHRDLLSSDVAVLATVGEDGRPQVSAVWFHVDDDTIAVSLNTARQKTKNLQNNRAATLFILDRGNPYRYLEVRGDADLRPDEDYAFADKVGAKYQSDLRAHDRPGERRVKVVINPVRINAVDMGG
jgi:PPOX class probable F420-dependent enzyme